MIKSRKRMTACLTLLALNLVFIWGNSLMDSEASSQFSGWVGEILADFLHFPAGETQSGHGLLRKMAHFTEFACLGALICWYLSMMGHRRKTLAVLTVLLALAVACIDETIQIFVSGRSSSLIDVWIDSGGGTIGMIFLLTGHHLFYKYLDKNRRK